MTITGDCAPAAQETDARTAAVHRVEAQMGELFGRVRTMFAEIAERFHPGMLPATYRAFTTIARMGPVTASVIADKFIVDKAQISRIVRELEGHGYVSRSPDPADGRASLLTATELGLERLRIARGPQEHQLSESLAHWDVEQIESLADLLRALNTDSRPSA